MQKKSACYNGAKNVTILKL